MFAFSPSPSTICVSCEKLPNVNWPSDNRRLSFGSGLKGIPPCKGIRRSISRTASFRGGKAAAENLSGKNSSLNSVPFFLLESFPLNTTESLRCFFTSKDCGVMFFVMFAVSSVTNGFTLDFILCRSSSHALNWRIWDFLFITSQSNSFLCPSPPASEISLWTGARKTECLLTPSSSTSVSSLSNSPGLIVSTSVSRPWKCSENHFVTLRNIVKLISSRRHEPDTLE